MMPQAVSYQNSVQPAMVPAALAPYAPQSPFSTALPPAESVPQGC